MPHFLKAAKTLSGARGDDKQDRGSVGEDKEGERKEELKPRSEASQGGCSKSTRVCRGQSAVINVRFL